MSVLIKTMEMPETCGGCQFRDSWICHAMDDNVLRFDERDERCPLTEVPTPHGDLINLETAKKTVRRALEVNCKRLMNTAIPMLIDYALDNIPVMIEAEDGE